MTKVNMHQAKTHLSHLVRQVVKGEEVVIARAGRPLVRLVPVVERKPRQLGQDRGLVKIADEFDAPLPEDFVRTFEA